ncbi:hypothetical protein K439DRAFT_418530 [Ramaria rubella]|nr:hypothetical protein K439DRAFT_418530 [Ramaria rubella]
MIFQTLILFHAAPNIANIATSLVFPIEAILVSRLLLDLREAERRSGDTTISLAFTTIPMDGDGLMRNPVDDAERISQAFQDSSASYMMDVSLNFDNEPQRRGCLRRERVVTGRNETRIDVSEGVSYGREQPFLEYFYRS